jgi:hypothetical protein
MQRWSDGVLCWIGAIEFLDYSITAASPRLQCPTEILKSIKAFLNYINAGGVTEPHGAIVAEGSAGHDCNVCLT